MKILLKYKNDFYNAYRIKRGGETGWITGWYPGLKLNEEFHLGASHSFDVHFTYPENGNYHYTYTHSFKGEVIEKLRIFQQGHKLKYTYWCLKDVNRKYTVLLGRKEIDHMMPGYGYSINLFSNEPLRFAFPMVSFDLAHEKAKIGNNNFFKKSKLEKNGCDDLIIDLEKYHKGRATVGADLLGRDKQIKLFGPEHKVIQEFKREKYNKYPIIEIHYFIGGIE